MLEYLYRSSKTGRKKAEKILSSLYGRNRVEENINRYVRAVEEFRKLFPDREVELFSSPGRTEIAGNHTDHNGGAVLAASIDLDSVCAAAKNSSRIVTVFSEGFSDPFQVDLNDLDKRDAEEGTTGALIRGTASRFREIGYEIGGFEGFITSTVPIGSGLSSSASIEVLLGSVFNYLYNNGEMDPLEIARIGQYAENRYFGKPCGLMDQIACSVGGVVMIDFADSTLPLIERVHFSFRDYDYAMLIVDTGSGHSDLTDDYALVTEEMRSVAGAFGQKIMREVAFGDFRKNIGKLRLELSDRAILRAYHFLSENERVFAQRKALEKRDIGTFLDLVQQSGDSSAKWLQNSFSVKEPGEQGIALACAVSEDFFRGKQRGAFRVHGGGFAGTIQVFINRHYVAQYNAIMEEVFGEGSVTELQVRSAGAVRLKALFDSEE